MIDRTVLSAHLDDALADATIAELSNHYRGKVRDNYDLPDGRRIIIATDRVSAFDRVIAAIPFKGQVLTQLARFWFEATADLCPNHVIGYPDPNVLVCHRLAIMPVEIVVRDYLTGTTGTSIWPMYKTGRREIYGVRFPDGLRENQKLPATIITPTTKAPDGGHDEPLTRDEIVGRGLLTAEQWQMTTELALTLFARGRAIAEDRGLILVDTKYEFGFDPDGQIILADEVHTPDSSRYWLTESYAERFAAGEPRQGFRAALGGGAVRPLPRSHSGDPAQCHPRSCAGLHRSVRDNHRAEFRLARSRHPGACPHPREPGTLFLTRPSEFYVVIPKKAAVSKFCEQTNPLSPRKRGPRACPWHEQGQATEIPGFPLSRERRARGARAECAELDYSLESGNPGRQAAITAPEPRFRHLEPAV